jgi:hypothetical protein
MARAVKLQGPPGPRTALGHEAARTPREAVPRAPGVVATPYVSNTAVRVISGTLASAFDRGQLALAPAASF